jgi:hypothetical protein
MHSLACLLLAVAAVGCFAQLASHPQDLLVGPQHEGRNDVSGAFLAFRSFPTWSLEADGCLPLWNPHGLTGIAWHGNPQSALFYPFNWLYLLFDPVVVISWGMVLHQWWAGVGGYLLGRRYGFGFPAALFSGVALLAAPYALAQIGEGHYTQICLVAWIPWAFLAYERFRRGLPGGVPLQAIALALCFFCGHAQETYYLVLCLTTFVFLDTFRARNMSAGVAPTKLLVSWGAVGLLTVGLVAVDLLPIWIYTQHATRAAGLTIEQAAGISLGTASLWQLLDPFVLGDASTYHGPGQFYWETLCHFGIVTTLLAIIGATRWQCSSAPIGRLVVMGLLAMLFAFGSDTPLFAAMYRFVPGISYFRSPSRSLFFASFAAAVLAGQAVETIIGWASSVDGFSRRRTALVAVVMAVACSVGFALASSSGGTAEPIGQQVDWLSVTMWAGGASLIVCCSTWAGSRASIVAAGLAILCAMESASFSQRVLATLDRSSLRETNPIIERVRTTAPQSRLMAMQEHVSDREAWRAGVSKVQGYDPVPLTRFGLYLAATVAPRDPAFELTGYDPVLFHEYRKPLVDLLGVEYAVAATDRPVEFKGWELVDRRRLPAEFVIRGETPRTLPVAVYRNQTAMPRAFVLGRVSPLDPREDYVERLKTIDPRHEVLLEQDVLPAGDRQELKAAEIVDSTSTSITIKAELTAAGYLILTDAWYPGWTALVDGVPTPVLPAYVAFRAVPLSAGKHTVEFRYRPPLATIGAGVSLLAFAACGLALVGSVVGSRDNDKEGDA